MYEVSAFCYRLIIANIIILNLVAKINIGFNELRVHRI